MAAPVRIDRRIGGPAAPPRPLGAILLERGWIGADALGRVLEGGAEHRRRIGEVAAARGLSGETEVAAALAEQAGLGAADLEAEPPDPALIGESDDADTCLHHRVLPWRTEAGRIVYATDRPEGIAAARARIGDASIRFAIATPRQMDAALTLAFGPALARRAAGRVHRAQSVRSLGPARWAAGGLAAAAALTILAGGEAALAAGFGMVLATHLATLLLRILALAAGARAPRRDRPAALHDAIRLADRRPLPVISLLVPLYRETAMVRHLLAALAALDYPRELMDVKLLVEAEDRPMREALARVRLPGWIAVLVVPEGRPRTKPRALNVALDFCRGDIVGVLDAEDRPESGQLRSVARRFADSPPETVALQCQLAFYNSRRNWFSRCFELEYAIWFEVFLRGYRRLRLPLPLGGTSVYFRAGALRRLDGWDAHNVTEDADLGMRLVRAGGQCDVLASTTREEAACRPLAWIRQRSRWTKGYLLTWMSHMRDPVALWRDLGPANFLALNVILLGGVITYLAMPLFWLSLAGWLATGDGLWDRAVPAGHWLTAPLAGSLVLGWAVMLGAALIAMTRRGSPELLAWAPTLPLYWWLGAIAAWKAVVELLVAPYYWDKTEHGVALPDAATPESGPPGPGERGAGLSETGSG